jgi:transcriptional regulator with XRE-family HTH domain
MNFNYQKICQNLLKDLPERQREVIERRFGLKSGQRETLESIGQDFGITRERVRQIENDAILKLRPKLTSLQKIFQYFSDQLKATGDLRKEEILLSQLGGENEQAQVFFLLTLGEPFQRFPETKEFYSLWTINPDSLVLAQKTIKSLYEKLKKINQPLNLKELNSFCKTKEEVLTAYLEISKLIQKNQEGLFGLRDWPEINPRGIKDKAYLVFKKEKRPLHFTEVAKLIGPEALVQTVHNELIRDSRFVLVGRGLYGLKEWGYEDGDVKDIILKILREARKPLPKEEVLERVLKQRLVKENTILLNLSNKKYFLRTPEGKYTIRIS